MTNVRRTSEQRFPHNWPASVCYFELCDGDLMWMKTRGETRDAVHRALAGDSTLYAAWPGRYQTDLFLVDDVDKFAAALNMSPAQA